MKKRTIALVTALAISALLLMSAGAYLKYEVLAPYRIAQDKNIVELPFLLMADDALRYEVELAFRPEEPTEEPTTEPTEEPTTEPTEEPTTKPTEEPTTKPTEEPTTEPTEEPTTEPTEEPTTEPTEEPTTEPTEEPTTEPTEEPTTEPTEEPTTEPTEEPTTEPTEEPTTEPTEEPTTEPTTDQVKDPYSYPGYDFSGGVGDEWYEDVLFIGDSRTLGLKEYARSGNADYFCGVGMSVFNVQSTRAGDENFSRQYLEDLLASRSYGKVFINLGINECGYATSSLISAYKDLIELIRNYQPDAKIIIQAIMTVSKGYSSASYFQPEHIFSINRKLEAMADGAEIFYIDVNKYFNDPDGYLYEDITGDGCHLYASDYRVWRDWISYEAGKLGI